MARRSYRAPARRSTSGSRTRTYATRASRAPARKSSRRVSTRAPRQQTVRVVIQHVGGQTSPIAGNTEKAPLRARF